MSDKRRRRRAKQARRDARRLAAYEREPPDDESLAGLLRRALAKGPPLGLLAVASHVIWRAEPDWLADLRSPPHEPIDLDAFIANLTSERHRETTAVLAVLAELMVDDPDRQVRCRDEVTRRRHALPKWISALRNVQIRRVVRATHVLGDIDELIIGVQLAGRYDIMCKVRFDHNLFSTIDGVDITYESADDALLCAVDDNPDFDIAEMSPADAGAWLRHGLDRPMLPLRSDRWPEVVPLVRWLASHLPDGGEEYQRPEWDWRRLDELCRDFFATTAGAPFDDLECRSMLDDLVESGTGDPLRWSTTRIAQLLRGPLSYVHDLELDSALALPDLLRAFIPFAHARSGIRDEFTAEAVAFIDKKARAYRREVLKDAS